MNKERKINMKKTLALLIAGLLVMCGLSACAFGKKKPNLEILPTMQSKSTATNQVWVGTFQLIWNDLVNEIIKNPVEFVGTKSIMADELNKQAFTTDELSDSSYYKKFDKTSPKLKKEIEKGIMEKFNEKSDILDQLDWTEDEGKYTLYAMLKKDFEFTQAFSNLAPAKFHGSKGKVKYFGLEEKAPADLRKMVHVLFYNNDDDFAVSISTKGDDVVYLYRTNSKGTLEDLYWDMQKKFKTSISNPRFTEKDEIKIPNFDFKSERNFDELCDKQIQNSNLKIAKAIETIDFKMDNKGVKLKSEAAMSVMKMSLMPDEPTPRHFYFNDNFVIFLQEKDRQPYFAMRVSDVKSLQK